MNFLSVADLTPDALAEVLRLAAEVKAAPERYSNALAGRSIGLFFAKQSLRTWVSCDVAAIQLGAHPLSIRDDTAGLGTRETPADVARVLDRYLDLLALRVHRHEDLVEIAAHADMPIVNLLSDREHPCQALADLQTVAEHRPLAEATITFVGDGNNVCHSLILGAVMAGARMRLVGPPGYEPDPAVVALAREHGEVTLFEDPYEAVAGSDVVYTDVWASMGQEAEAELRRRHFEPYRVTLELFERANPDAIFMHCLPAHRGEEVVDEVIDHPRSVVFDQAENRLHSFKALLLHLL
ncbi:MAG: ornithine carbamoyltransferase [Actinomycetes bacterium]|jgi:ornithine carbamoyltransferase|nr:ornithine carbamoyltransferase [Acidimicrobiia bacterium]